MIIEIESKGGGLAATFDAVQGPVPRAGDVLASGDYAALLNGNTIVLVVAELDREFAATRGCLDVC